MSCRALILIDARSWLCVQPYSSCHVQLQNGRFDDANRLFISVNEAWCVVSQCSHRHPSLLCVSLTALPSRARRVARVALLASRCPPPTIRLSHLRYRTCTAHSIS